MKIRRLGWLGARVNHSLWLLMIHRVTLVLVKLRGSMRTVQPHSFRILAVIVLTVSLLRLILLLYDDVTISSSLTNINLVNSDREDIALHQILSVANICQLTTSQRKTNVVM